MDTKILGAISYIQGNLTEDITLQSIAEMAYVSPFHFHRLFQLETGETLMEYIRRLRLRSASQEILSTQCSILDIALRYRFDSQEGFSRAFKRYYGITPGEYRKRNVRRNPTTLSQKQEENSMLYDSNVYEKAACSHDEKLALTDTLDKILALSQTALNSGLLALEMEIETLQPELMKKAVQMLIDGFEPVFLREILLNYIHFGNLKGKELLQQILISEGILGIQQGMLTDMIREKLASILGEDCIMDVEKYYQLDNSHFDHKIQEYLKRTQDKSCLSKDTSLLEDPLEKLDSRSLQRLLRELDIVIMSSALWGASGRIQARVLRHVSKKTANAIIHQLEMEPFIPHGEIAGSQKQILEIMHQLKRSGDLAI